MRGVAQGLALVGMSLLDVVARVVAVEELLDRQLDGRSSSIIVVNKRIVTQSLQFHTHQPAGDLLGVEQRGES